MSYKIGICDDEKSTCRELESIIINYFHRMNTNVDVQVWYCAETFMKDVPSKVELNILFLDIELPGLNGVEVGNYIREFCKNEAMQIIYISSKTSYAMELFKIHPYNFLIKPINSEKLCNEISKILRLDEQDKRFFIYEYNRTIYKILIGDILYFKSNRKHISIVCMDKTKEYVGKIKEEIKKLPENFVMIGQSYIVNLRHVKECSVDSVTLDNGDCLKISRNYKNSFNIRIIEYNKMWSV